MGARLLVALVFAGAASLALGQTDQQQSRVVEEPGVVDKQARDAAPKPEAIEPSQDADAARCAKLEGLQREQCLRDLGAGSGASVPPKPVPPTAVQRDPVTDPPPQNPRQPR